MTFDEILDFLFHRILGICIMIASTVLLVIGLSSCIPLDFCACFWQCGGCTDCATTCASCSQECDDVCYGCFGGKNGGAINDCLFGPSGCEKECGDCYVDCGGVNYTCYQALFDDGCGEGCHDVDGFQRFTCMNCVAYCEGTKDPASPNYQRIFLFNLKVIGHNGSESTVEFYENTKYISYSHISGLAFKGYFTAPGGEGTQITDQSGYIIAKPSKNATVYAHYTDAFEGIKFTFNIYELQNPASNSSGIRLMDSFKEVVSGTDMSNMLPTPKEFDGYTFKSWEIYTSYLAGTVVGDKNGFLNDYAIFNPAKFGFSPDSIGSLPADERTVNLIATYEKITCSITIKFPSDLGFADKVSQVDYGSMLYEVARPYTAEGKKFVGFSYEEDGIDSILDRETTTITDDVTVVYAIYSDIIKINFKEDGKAAYSQEFYVGQTATLPEPKNIPAGQQYDGWTLSTDFSRKFKTLEITSSHDGITLVPSFTKATYNITYMTGETVLGTDTYSMGTSKTLRVYDVEYNTFTGWKDTKTGKTYSGTLPDTVYGDLTLEAVLTPKTYTIYLQANGGTVTSPTKTVTYGKEFTITPPTRKGYTFLGWSYSTGLQDVMLTDEKGKSLDTYKKYSGAQFINELDLTVTAKWQINQYTVSFVVEGEVVHAPKVTYRATVSPPSDPTVKGKDFVGWYKGTTAFDFTSEITADTTITAKFNPKTYTLVFDVGNSADWENSLNQTITVQYTYGSKKITLPDKPVRDGYTFAGWYSGMNGTGTFVIDASGNVLLLDSIIGSNETYSLYAKWVAD